MYVCMYACSVDGRKRGINTHVHVLSMNSTQLLGIIQGRKLSQICATSESFLSKNTVI